MQLITLLSLTHCYCFSDVYRTKSICSRMEPICLHVALYDSAAGLSVLSLLLSPKRFVLVQNQIGLFHHPLYPCSHSFHPLNVPLSLCPLLDFPQHFPFTVHPSFCLSLVAFLLFSSHQQNVLLRRIHPSLWPFSYLFPSITLSLLHHPSHPCLPPEIITTSLVKISLYLNSWISKAWGCWQSLFNNSQLNRSGVGSHSLRAALKGDIWKHLRWTYWCFVIVIVPCNEQHSRVKIHLYVASLSLWPQIQAHRPNVHIQLWLGGF